MSGFSLFLSLSLCVLSVVRVCFCVFVFACALHALSYGHKLWGFGGPVFLPKAVERDPDKGLSRHRRGGPKTYLTHEVTVSAMRLWGPQAALFSGFGIGSERANSLV
jgi:hypothetical protein